MRSSRSSLAHTARRYAAGSTALLLSGAFLLAQDECTSAVAVFNGANGPFSNVGMTTSAGTWTCAFNPANDSWYAYIATGTGLLTVDTCGLALPDDTVVQVFDGTSGCGALTVLGCNDDGCGFPASSLTVACTSGTTYFIRVGGYNGSVVQSFPLNITLVVPGDECVNADVIVNGVNGPYSNAGYTTSAPAWPCGAGGNDRWFVYTATCSGTVTVDTCGGGYDSTLEAFDFCGGTSLACNDDSCGLQSSITFPVVQSTSYYVRMGGFGGATGSAPVNVTCTAIGVQNDECVNAVALAVGANGPFSNAGSTTSSPWPCGLGGNDIWFYHVATCCGYLTFDTCGGGYDSTLEVFDACGGISLACNDDAATGPCQFTLQSSVTVFVAAGQTVYVRMGGFAGSTGSAPINVACVAGAPANDDCAGAIPVALGTNGPFSNACSTTSVPAWPCGLGANDVWFVFQANCTCPTTFQTCGANYDSTIEVFDGTNGCANLVSLGCNDDNGTGGPCLFTLQSWLTVPLTNGGLYYVRVGGFAGSIGNFPLEISTGTGLGSIALTTPTTCGVPGLALAVTGNPNIGGTVTATMSGFTGLPFVSWGFAPAPLLSPACPCLILSVSTSWLFAPAISLTVPCDAIFIGLPLEVQGADLFGAPAACGFPVPNAFTDVWTVTIG